MLQVGRLIPVKAADVLVEAVAAAPSMDVAIRLVLAGEGSGAKRSSLSRGRGGVIVCATGQLEAMT